MSGRYAAAPIDRDKYEVYHILFNADNWFLIEWESEDSDKFQVLGCVDKGTFSCNGVRFDIACIMIHGIPGENGLLQGYFEMMGVPVTTCSSFVCTVAFNKDSCKSFLRDTGVKMAEDVFLHKGDTYDVDAIVAKLSLPVFVKPSDGGSSFGVTKVKKVSEMPAAIEAAFKESDTLLIERAVVGREVTQAAYTSGGKVTVLPVTEIITENEYFDYEAKYLGKSDEVCPADVTDAQKADISYWTERIYRHLGCTGLVRMDYIMAEDGVYFLEINATPGMTRMSLVPKMVRVAGIDMGDFFTELIESAR